MKNSKKKSNDVFLSEDELRALEQEFRSIGYLLPTNEDELAKFDQIHGTTQVILPDNLKKPDFLFNNDSTSSKKTKIKKIASIKSEATKNNKGDYFKKIVLAAKIADELYMEPTFGHKKFVKILYLCTEICNMELSVNFGQYAAGPLDPKLIYSIDREFKKQNWFEVVPREKFGFKYEPLFNIDQYKKYFKRYYSNQSEQINQLIELFRKLKSNNCEIIATLYAVWKRLILQRIDTNNSNLVEGFYNWSKEKRKFSTIEIEQAINWMNDNDIVPKAL